MQRKVTTLAIIHEDNRVLLGMKKRGFGVGRWNGFGGKVETGETIEEAAKRETTEEVGIKVSKMEKLGILEFRILGEDFIREVHIFKIHTWRGEPQETEEMKPRWFSSSEIPFASMWADDPYWFPFFLAGKKFTGKAYFPDHSTMKDFEFKEASSLD